MSSKISYKRLDDLVYEKIKAMILAERLKPGTKILQDQLARELGVSRTPVRKALSQLAKENLVTQSSRGTSCVRSFNREEMIEIFEIRQVLEGLACRKASSWATKKQLAHFRGLYHRAMKGASDTDWEIYEKADTEFHSFLFRISGGHLLENIIRSFHILSDSFGPGLVRPPKETLPEHMAIIDALRERDGNQAEILMRQHLGKSIAALRQSSSRESQRDAGTVR